MLILTAASLVTCFNPLGAAEETAPPADLLQLQKELVATLDLQLNRMREERRVGHRTDLEITLAMEDYYKELETACVMEAHVVARKTVKDAQILLVRIEAVSTALEMFNAYDKSLQARQDVGEITEVDTATGKAAALKTAIRLATLKKQLPAKAGKPARPCEIAAQPEAPKQPE